MTPSRETAEPLHAGLFALRAHWFRLIFGRWHDQPIRDLVREMWQTTERDLLNPLGAVYPDLQEELEEEEAMPLARQGGGTAWLGLTPE